MKKRLIPVLILTVGVAAVAAVVLFSPRPQPVPQEQPAPLEVPVLLADPQTHRLAVTSQGTLQPKRAIESVAQVAGQVVDVADNFADGAVIQAGDFLLQIDQRDYRHALARAEAGVAQAAEALASERGRALQAKREWRDLGDDAANELFLRKPQLAAAEANLAAARAERDQAQLNLDRTRITAPFTGRIEETLVDLGQYVSPGTPLATLYDASVAEVHLPLTSQQAGLLNLPLQHTPIPPQQQPDVALHGDWLGRLSTWHGKLVRVQARVDETSRFYYVVAEVTADSTTQPLPIGVFVEASIASRPLENLVTLPASALLKRREVYIVNHENRVEPRQVELVKASPERVWLRGDLPAGTPVMVGKQSLVTAGAEVTPQVVPAKNVSAPEPGL